MSLNWVTERPASAALRCEQERDPKRVLVLLGSVVISEALSNLLRTCGYDCYSGNQAVADPDLIIADGATLEGDLLRPYAKARVLLLETQPESGRMARTFLSHKLHGIISCTTDLQKFKRALVAVIEGRVWVDDPSIQSFLLDAGLISKRGRRPFPGAARGRRVLHVLSPPTVRVPGGLMYSASYPLSLPPTRSSDATCRLCLS